MRSVYSTNELLKLIDINPPYFAYSEIYSEGDFVYADLPVEQPLGAEIGPVSAAEASRHLAILGVCSCALVNPVKKRHYYLAYKGIYERKDADRDPSLPYGKLTAKARCISLDKKKAEAVTELYDENGTQVILLKVFYHVIPDMLFERMYKNHYIENPAFVIANPYKYLQRFEEEVILEDEMRCAMGAIPSYYCAGHFPKFPALPVAVLVYNLFRISCKLASILKGSHDSKYVIRAYEITADNLAFSGDNVSLQTRYIRSLGPSTHEFFAEGISNEEKSVGKISLVLEECMENKKGTHLKNAALEPVSDKKRK